MEGLWINKSILINKYLLQYKDWILVQLLLWNSSERDETTSGRCREGEVGQVHIYIEYVVFLFLNVAEVRDLQPHVDCVIIGTMYVSFVLNQ